MTFTLQALNDEITNDPEAIGYKTGATWKGDQEIADLINAGTYFVDRKQIDVGDLRNMISFDAFGKLTEVQRGWLQWVIPSVEKVPLTEEIKMRLSGRAVTSEGSKGSGSDAASIWDGTNQTLARKMLALMEKSGSRAEVLWGDGVIISAGQVARAANL